MNGEAVAGTTISPATAAPWSKLLRRSVVASSFGAHQGQGRQICHRRTSSGMTTTNALLVALNISSSLPEKAIKEVTLEVKAVRQPIGFAIIVFRVLSCVQCRRSNLQCSSRNTGSISAISFTFFSATDFANNYASDARHQHYVACCSLPAIISPNSQIFSRVFTDPYSPKRYDDKGRI